MIQINSKRRKPRKSVRRSEINGGRRFQAVWNRQTVREIEDWLLRSGLSPNANRSVSEIGIYTDFT